MQWDIIAASVAGTKHIKKGKPCEDAHGFWQNENVAVFAVADGAGSAKHAAIGSTLVIDALINTVKHKALCSYLPDNPKDLKVFGAYLANIIRYELEKRALGFSFPNNSMPEVNHKNNTKPHEFGRSSRKSRTKKTTKTKPHGLSLLFLNFIGLFFNDEETINSDDSATQLDHPSVDIIAKAKENTKIEIVEKVHQEKINRNILKEYSSTVLAVIVTNRWLLAFQIGDGVIVIQQADRLVSLTTPSKGEYYNVTDFVTSSSYMEKFQVLVIPNNFIDRVFLMTDGLESLAVNLSNNNPHAGFFSNIINYFKELTEKDSAQTTKEKNALLAEILDGKSVNKKTDDDKTFIMATRQKD